MIAASALICGRTAAELSDLWVMKYIWDTDEQVEILASMIDNVIKNDVSDKSHPQAHFNRIPNAEELMKEVELLTSKWKTENLPFEEKSILKDKLRYVQSRSNWISNAEHKRFIQSSMEETLAADFGIKMIFYVSIDQQYMDLLGELRTRPNLKLAMRKNYPGCRVSTEKMFNPN